MEDDDFGRSSIDTRRLIAVVKKYPAIYDSNDPNYTRCKAETRNVLWQQICREAVPNWNTLKKEGRIVCVYQVQKRWKNIRTCFSRELFRQQEDKERRLKNLPVKTRKVYQYYNMLRFLPGVNDPQPAENSDDSLDPLTEMKTEMFDRGESHFEIETVDDIDDTYTQDYESNDGFEATDSNSVKTKDKCNRSRNNSLKYERQSENVNVTTGDLVEYLKDVKKDEDDEDRHFLMSLMPTFRKLDDKQKFEARIEILKVLKDISFRCGPGPSSGKKPRML